MRPDCRVEVIQTTDSRERGDLFTGCHRLVDDTDNEVAMEVKRPRGIYWCFTSRTGLEYWWLRPLRQPLPPRLPVQPSVWKVELLA